MLISSNIATATTSRSKGQSNPDSSTESDDHDTELDPCSDEWKLFLTWRRQPHLLDMTCQAMFAWLVTVILVSLLLKCLHGGKSPSSVLHGFWNEPLLGSLNQTFHKKEISIIEWLDVRSSLTGHFHGHVHGEQKDNTRRDLTLQHTQREKAVQLLQQQQLLISMRLAKSRCTGKWRK